MTTSLQGHLAMFLFSILVAGSFALGALAANEITPLALNVVRFWIATVVMGVVVVMTVGIKRADARRTISFVTGEHEEIAIKILHIDRTMHGTLATVDQNRNAACVGNPTDFPDRHICSKRVGHMRDRDDLRAIVQQLFKFFEEEIPVVIDR